MTKNLKKPIVFLLTIALILSAVTVPTFASSLYSEGFISNTLDTGFEKQNEIQQIKSNDCNGFRTLSTDANNGRFSLKLGKQSTENSVFCPIIENTIDLTKYNQVTMWVKTKSYNTAINFYAVVNSNKVTISAIESANLKSGEWQEIKLNLASINASEISGIYTWAYTNKVLLIDDVAFTKNYTSVQNWPLNSGTLNTFSTQMNYKENVGVTLKSNPTNPSAYDTEPKVASIHNSVDGQITGIKINSASQDTITTDKSNYLDYIVATNPALYAISEDGNKVYYYNQMTDYLELKDRVTNQTFQIKKGAIKQIKTNENGSLLAVIDNTSTLYFIIDPKITNNNNFTTQAKMVTSGGISNIFFNRDTLYYNLNNILYSLKKDILPNSLKITDLTYSELYKSSEVDASLVSGSSIYRYYYYSKDVNINNLYSNFIIYRHDNFFPSEDVQISSNRLYFSSQVTIKANNSGNLVFYKTLDSSSRNINYYAVLNANTSTSSIVSLGGDNVTDLLIVGSHLFYYKGNQRYKIDSMNPLPVTVSAINYSIDSNANNNEENLIYAEEKESELFLISKTLNYDKELLIDFGKQKDQNTKIDSITFKNIKYSTLPNQVIAQMENGDIYAIDTKTKTNRLLINGMVLYRVLDNGKLLLSDMKDTGRFLIYDQVSKEKQVFRLDNRSTGAAFSLTYNAEKHSVIYLNKDNKMQEVLLTGADVKDRYALMFNNDGKWWTYKNNAWQIVSTGSAEPSVGSMDTLGMTAQEVNSLTEKDFSKLPSTASLNTLGLAVYFSSNSQYAPPVLKGITIETEDKEATINSKTAYGTRIKEYNKGDFRNISAIHVTENKDKDDEIYYFLIANDKPYSIRNGQLCKIDKNASSFFNDVKGNFDDILSYGMDASELADLNEASLKKILIDENTTNTFGIVAVIKSFDKNTENIKIDYVLESLQKRFDDNVKSVSILLTDNTLLEYKEGDITKEEIERFADWVMDRKYNRGPVFFTFHIGNKYKIVNYYMIKMFSVE